MLSIGSVVWGVRDVPRATEFWSQALDLVPREDADDDWVMLVPRDGDGVRLALQEVTSDRARRHHLDLFADDREAEAERLIGLGATRVENWDYEEDADYILLEDTEGNRFCVCS